MGDEERDATAAATAQHAGIVVDCRIDGSLISIALEPAGVYNSGAYRPPASRRPGETRPRRPAYCRILAPVSLGA